MQASPDEIIKPLRWLIGKWKSVSTAGIYPTIEPFTYNDEIEFKSIGQPMLCYSSYTKHPETHKPMHLETGFLRIKPGTNQVALILAHNFGITSLEEGCVDEEALALELKSTNISRMTFAASSVVTELARTYKYYCDTNELQLILYMATTKTPLTEHLRVTYIKC